MRKIINYPLIFKRHNLNKISCYLCCIILFALVFWAISHTTDEYKIQNIVRRPSLQRFGKDFSSEIQTTRIFVENYINPYLNLIQAEIDPAFRKSFTITKSKKLSIRAVFSTVAETLLCIYPSTKNELIVDCTKYPVQMALFSGLDMSDSNAHLNVPYEEALRSYNELDTGYRIAEGVDATLVNFILNLQYPKAFSFSKNSLQTLVNVEVRIRNAHNQVIRTLSMEPVCILTGEKDFSFAKEKASALGRQLAIAEIKHLFFTSEFFRQALAEERLNVIARKIQSDSSRAEKDTAFDYPLWKFKRDMADLQEEAREFGLGSNYPSDLLKHPANKPKDGVLLWYYANYFEFSLQWVLVNAFLLVFFSILLILRRKKNKLALLIDRLWPKAILLLSINGWIFYVKPRYMGVKYWIIPGVLFLACFFLNVLKPKKTEGGKN